MQPTVSARNYELVNETKGDKLPKEWSEKMMADIFESQYKQVKKKKMTNTLQNT